MLSIVVPTFNSEQSIPVLADRIKKTCDPLGAFELILVDDCSRDRTWEVIQHLARSYPWVKGIRLMRNYGQHNALLCGIRSARYELILTMDDDLQNPPEEIPALLARLQEGYDVVYGYPQKQAHTVLRNFASVVTKFVLQKSMGAETARYVSPFRLFRTNVRNAFESYQGPFVSIDVLLTWGTQRFTAVAVRSDPRRIGKSQYTFAKLMTHTMNMLTGFSSLPLQVASISGLIVGLCGLAALLYVLYTFLLFGRAVPGFAFLASMVSIFSGIQLFVLGILGEYLSRVHFRVMDKPSYTVQCSTEEDTDSDRTSRLRPHHVRISHSTE